MLSSKVEHALLLTVDNDYDFVTNKLVPKPDPSHPTRKPTMTMLAFSETIWEPRAEFYLEKGVSKLKEKDWENVMKAAASYSNVIKAPLSSKGKQRAPAVMEEELELTWDSESDEMDK